MLCCLSAYLSSSPSLWAWCAAASRSVLHCSWHCAPPGSVLPCCTSCQGQWPARPIEFLVNVGIVGPYRLYLGHLGDFRSWSEGPDMRWYLWTQCREWHKLSLVDLLWTLQAPRCTVSLVGIAFCFPSWEWFPPVTDMHEKSRLWLGERTAPMSPLFIPESPCLHLLPISLPPTSMLSASSASQTLAVEALGMCAVGLGSGDLRAGRGRMSCRMCGN